MGLIILPNQTIKFLTPGETDFNTFNESCTQDGRVYCQPITRDTPTKFQILTSPQDGVNLVPSNGFFFNPCGVDWTCVGGWGITGNQAVNPGATPTSDFIAAVNLTAGQYYRVRVNVLGLSSPVPSSGLNPVLGGGTPLVPSVTNGASGMFTWFTQLNTVTANEINISLGVGVSVVINYVEVLEYTTPTVTVEDCEGNHLATITDLEFKDGYVVVNVDWSALAFMEDGCYKICVYPIGNGTNILNCYLLKESGDYLLLEDGCKIKLF